MAIQSRALIKSWFELDDYPTQEQFADWIDSFFHRTEDSISSTPADIRDALQSLTGVNRLQAVAILTDALNRFVTDTQITNWDAKLTHGDLTGAIDAIKDNVPTAGNTLNKLYTSIQALQSLVTSDDVNLDTVQEIVNLIKSEQGLIDNLTTNKVNKSDIVDNLLSNDTQRPLSANQGNVLKLLIDALTLVVGGKQASLGYTPENLANKGQANGYASLGSDGKVPAGQLPGSSITGTVGNIVIIGAGGVPVDSGYNIGLTLMD